MNPEIMSLLRHALTVGGGFLIAHGYVDTIGMESIIGGVMAVLAVAWAMYSKQASSPEAINLAAKVITTPPPAPLLGPVATDPSTIVAKAQANAAVTAK